LDALLNNLVDDIEQALSKLQSQNYQSDQRFANEFIQMRFNQGKGPIKIATDLKQRGLSLLLLRRKNHTQTNQNYQCRVV
jgi:SOS response regulatory protein OraA/RecX